TVYQFMSTNYALAVEYQGQVVGYVKEESVYQNAEKMVKGRIVYTDSNQQSWSIDPTFSVVAASNAEISDTETLANAILEKSGAEISEAVGLYVDGQFYGATTDALQLENDFEQIKKPYQEQYPDAEIGFVQNVELKSGVYLTSSVVEYSQLSSLLTSQVQGQRTYTIAQGDTPLIIAGKNDIKLADLYALNPVLENGKSVFVGQELLISGAQSFLQVKAVKTEVVEEEIPFTTNKTNDSNLAFGVSKTTQKGEKGLDSVTYTDTYVDGVRVSHTEVARTVLRAPVTEEVSVGAKVTTSGQTITMGTGPLMFPVGAGYKGMSRGFTGVYAHNGLDLRGYVGTPIYAAQSGVVTTAVYSNRGYGIHAVINHGGGMSTLYGHCSGLVVSAGQAVQKGQLIGYVGSTGNSTGPHCHFEVIMNGTRVNPMNYF
ncbi:MAG: M23 family metallopeptidase, partial [Pygmaiobacter massiliensis]|nr:M23 family metallopeptidase [Pygmaiobacter massiliensis]